MANKNKINWKRTLKNNGYMLSILMRACPGYVVISFISVIMGVVNSFLLDTYLYVYALNALQQGTELKKVLITLGCMITYSILNMVIQRIMSCYLALKYPLIDAHINNMLQSKAVAADLACFESSSFYDTYVKASGDATDRAISVLDNILNIVWVVLRICAVSTLIITIDPIFLALAVIPLIFTLMLGKKRNRIKHEYKMRSKEVARQRDYVRRTFYLSDFSKEMRLTSMWRVMFRRMHDSITEMKQIVDEYGYKMMFFRYLFDFAFDVLVYSSTIILAAFKTLVRKSMLLGDCFIVINEITNIAGSINYAGNMLLSLDENSLYIDNLRDFLEYEVRIAEDENAPAAEEFRSLELKNVTFGYENQANPALSDVSFKIKAGEKIAIVGHNGAGKTTLIKLLQRLYDPGEGEILLNGQNIKGFRLSSYRNLFGTVFQDYRLFAATVAENVMLRGDITDGDRQAAADALQKAGIYEKIQSLPRGIDSNVTREFDSEGAMFSGGEAQKLSIARIFAGDQEIVIMDEPTSALDPIAEQQMYRNMFEACQGKTVIFISHRLSSATMADRIYMFENGRIIEQGTHKQLLSANAKYADMWHKQADTYADTQEVTA